MQRAVCLLSGGLDSCVALACALADGCQPALLHAEYGQRTTRQEQRAFHGIADHYGLSDRLICDLSSLGQMGGSSLTDTRIQLPDGDLERAQIPNSYVPFRNANLLATAASWAENLGASAIFIGAVEEDSSGYPDCRRPFFDAFELCIELGTRPQTHIQVRTPLIDKTKAEIVRLGVELEAPLALSWSCYRNLDAPCLECDSCLLRQRGFQQAGVSDPALGG